MMHRGTLPDVESNVFYVCMFLQQAAEDEPYVYLPPGCSMKDPGYGHNSMSDPLEKRVHIRDPHPPKE